MERSLFYLFIMCTMEDSFRPLRLAELRTFVAIFLFISVVLSGDLCFVGNTAWHQWCCVLNSMAQLLSFSEMELFVRNVAFMVCYRFLRLCRSLCPAVE